MAHLGHGAGNLRGRNDPSTANCPRVCERTNVALVPYTAGSASYTFSSGKIKLQSKR